MNSVKNLNKQGTKKQKQLKLIFAVLALFCGFNFITQFAQAKEMPHRLGVGIKDNTSESIPSLAVVYYNSNVSAVTGGIGFDTKKDESRFQMNAGVRYIIFHETNLHYYAGGQLGVVSYETAAKGKQNGFETNLVLGVEYFFGGLENVGFSFEGGLGISTVDSTRVRTIADHPLKAGMIFYF